jgi:plasmid stability protein
MDRYMVDCRKAPSDNNCSLTIAGTKDEVLDAATAHAVTAHGHEDNAELREMLRGSLEPAERSLA